MAINFQQVPHEFWLCFQGLIEQGCWRLLPWGCFITWNVLLDPICWEPLRGWKVIFSHNHSTWQMTLGGQSCPQNFSWMAPQRLMYCFFFSKVQISWPKFSCIMPLFLHLRRSWSKKKKVLDLQSLRVDGGRLEEWSWACVEPYQEAPLFLQAGLWDHTSYSSLEGTHSAFTLPTSTY